MDDIREVILYIDKNNKYKAVEAASELLNRWEELGDPIVIPEEKSAKPLFAFTRNQTFQMEGGRSNVSFIVKEEYFDKIPSIIFDIIDTFEELGVSFKRIGYITSNFYPKSCIEKAKTIYLNEKAFDEPIEEINLSWYRKIPLFSNHINCWERIITDTMAYDNLLVQYDFNTPIDVIFDFDMRSIKEFLKVSHNYMKKRNKFDK